MSELFFIIFIIVIIFFVIFIVQPFFKVVLMKELLTVPAPATITIKH